MGENLDVADRGAVRTPMQWADEPGGGFSTGPPDRFPAPMPGGDYGPARVNVADARRRGDSLLNWMERLMRRRNETPELGFGDWHVVKADQPSVLVHRCDWQGSTVVAVHNFAGADRAVTFRLDGSDDVVGLDDLLDGERLALDGPEVTLDLPRYGYRWYRVLRRGARITP